MTTALVAAFEKAGIGHEETLYVKATQLLRQHGMDTNRAVDGLLAHIRESGDPQKFLRALARGFMRYVARDMNGASAPAGGQMVPDNQPSCATGNSSRPERDDVGHVQADAQVSRAHVESSGPVPGADGQSDRDSQEASAISATTPAQPAGDGQNLDGTQSRSAIPTSSASGGDQTSPDHHPTCVSPEAEAKSNPTQRPSILAAKRAEQVAAMKHEIALGRMTGLDKPVGDCTRAELERLARTAAVDAAYYQALAAAMPKFGNQKVRDFYDETEAMKALHAAHTAVGLNRVMLDTSWLDLKSPEGYREVSDA